MANNSPNTNPLTYNLYVQQMGILAVVDIDTNLTVYESDTDQNFNNIVPQMLNYAELRIQRDLDMLPSQTQETYTLTAGNNQFNIPIDDFVTIQTMQWAWLLNGVVQDSGPLLPVTKEFLNNVYNSPRVTGKPRFYAMYGDLSNDTNTNISIQFGPYPDQPYSLIVTGTQRAPSLNKYGNTVQASTVATYISTYYPDLLLMASMVYMSGYQRNFSAMSDDQNSGNTYEAQYLKLLPAARAEEDRKKFQGSDWSSYSTPPAATARR